MTIQDAQHIHFIGIGGIGISALAKMLVAEGKTVSGTNDSESPETLDKLRTQGVKITTYENGGTIRQGLTATRGAEDLALTQPHNSHFIDASIDAFVYSVAWEGKAPELLEAARATGKPAYTYFQALGEVAKKYKVIAISGTHGKTTTTAMTAEALIAAGFDPTVIVGSLVDWGSGVRSNFRRGESEYLVIEACEYRRHFLNFHPYILGVTNIELDHPDYYKNLADVEDAFAEFASQSETVLGEEAIQRYIERVPDLAVPGEHNRKNAALALAVCDALGADLDKVKEALANFTGTWRRMEYIGTSEKGARVYDDYAHHPTAIKATLAAMREQFPDKKITAVFEPHTYTRTITFLEQFAAELGKADSVILAPIYAAREKNESGVSSEQIAEKINAQGGSAEYMNSFDEIVKHLQDTATEDEVILVMGAGDITHVAHALVS